MAPSDKRRGLGRGLSALMSDVNVEQTGASSGGPAKSVQTVPIEMVDPNPEQPRKSFGQEEMNDLVSSIREKGIIQPLIVRPRDGGRYQLVAGERRWRAAQQASLHEVPVVVRDLDDLEVMEIAIIENVQRSDLNPVEEAMGYRQLMDRFGHTQERLAEALGKSRSHIANILRLLNLPDGVLALVADGKLSSGHARALVTADNPMRLAQKIVSEGLSVRATEALVKKDGEPAKSTERKSAPAPAKDADTLALEGDLSAALGMKVTLNHAASGEGGTLNIHYSTFDQLDEICQLIGAN